MSIKVNNREEEDNYEFIYAGIRIIKKQALPWEKLSGRTIMISGATEMIGKCLVDFLMHLNADKQIAVNVVAMSRNEVKVRERFSTYWGNLMG